MRRSLHMARLRGDGMAVTVKKLYQNATFLYGMNLVAGKGGMGNLVQWVHIVEDQNVTGFLHGGELVFTAGIMNRGGDWLLRFAERLKGAGASAFVVNLGPHTAEIPPEVAAFCDAENMPLFTIPWETPMVDMTRDFCHRIMRDEHTEKNIASIFKNILFKAGDVGGHVTQLERYGFQRGSRFCFVALSSPGDAVQEPELSRLAEGCARNFHDLFVSFSYGEARILVLVDYADDEIEAFVGNLLARVPDGAFHLGVSANQEGIDDQSANFERALSAMRMARSRGERAVFYQKLGFYKLLYAVSDKSVLRGIYLETIAPIEKYDRENRTELLLLLQAFIELDGNLLQVAKSRFMHRNTVTNQLKKIKTVSGFDPLAQTDILMLKTGLMIREIL